MKLYQNMIEIETIKRWNNQKTKWANKLIGVSVSDVGYEISVDPVYMPLVDIQKEDGILAVSFSNWDKYLFVVFLMNRFPYLHIVKITNEPERTE